MLFLQIQNINIMYHNEEDMTVVPIIKMVEIIMRIQVYVISWMNFDYKENGEKNTFPCKCKALGSCFLMSRT